MTKNARHAVAAPNVFDGVAVLPDHAVVIEGAHIADVVPMDSLPSSMPVLVLGGDTWLAPGFIDVQVNGGGDVLFNDAPSASAINTIAAAHRRYGTTGILPTLISDTHDKMCAAMLAAQAAAADNPSVLGIHFEGPFLSPGKPGVHNPQMFRKPDAADLELLTGWPAGNVLVTLAPEQVPLEFIAALSQAGVRVSLGHSMATYDETQAALQSGMTGFTHLFNAMRPIGSREPGPITAALEAPAAWFGMIVDGVHVNPEVLRIALRGYGHPMLVTDAMPPVGGKRRSFTLYGNEITVRDGRCTREDGTLAGAAIDMASCVRNTVCDLHVPLTKALCFASTEPAEFLGLGTVLGRLAPGFRADMVAFEPIEVDVLETWVAGVPNEMAEQEAATG
ncbi:N-acetylglucosamine-6-phosphate deacetylase [Hyphomicrobium sulfonivorans]|uniref:N-acetylglucosamine-6-phosphate deacetylase n=1 Tax=Hyphomicrobium sulfonivorans TaxID=121290 RepID=A0A109BQ51_HYPSL|nr:N-acetylglucosamine-6-phosphate deacetylase [Hyphomicrobium sulfonivorans]KWT72635.1 N-acetylglucosamine-6-phosphate deacetylase [Hyphomicrobium sulfonivorans]